MDHYARYYSPQVATRRGYGEDRGHRRAWSAPDHYHRGEDHRRTYREQPSSSHASKTSNAAPYGKEASVHGTRRRHSSSVAYRHEVPQEPTHRVHWTPSVKSPTYQPSEASYMHTHSQTHQAHRYPARYVSYEPTRGRSYPSARLKESTPPVYRQDERYKTSPPQYYRTSHRDRRHSPGDLEPRDMHRKSRQRLYEQSKADVYEHVRRPEHSERYSRGHTDYRSRHLDHPSGYSRYPLRRSEHETRKPQSLYRAVDPFTISQSKRLASPPHTADAHPIWNQFRQTIRHIGNKLFFPVHESHTLRGTSALKKGRKERRKDG